MLGKELRALLKREKRCRGAKHARTIPPVSGIIFEYSMIKVSPGITLSKLRSKDEIIRNP
jgi:hypothetical protein